MSVADLNNSDAEWRANWFYSKVYWTKRETNGYIQNKRRAWVGRSSCFMSVLEKCEKTFRNQFDPTGSKIGT